MDQKEEIKNRIDIVSFIGSYIELKKAGRNFKAICPFHTEKTPSFMVSPEKQIWHCFGCNEGGDIFSFAMKMESLDFFSALKMLADKVGIKLQREDRNYSKAKEKRDKFYEINEIVANYYEKKLFDKEGKEALSYLKKRGIKEESIKKFRLGFAPKKSKVLEELRKIGYKIGYKDEDLIGAGIAKRFSRDKGGERLLDYFWERIIFPICDSAGNVIGFSARTLSDKVQPKYLNTPDTEIYHKSKVLYGFDKAKEEIKRINHIILVEGYMDVIASHQAGVKNVVAVTGTALTESQLLFIKRFTKNIKMAFDMDMAGNQATKRAIEMAMREGFNLKIIEVPEGKDPAEAILKDRKIWTYACKNASYVIDYLFSKAFLRHNVNEILGKKEIARELLGVIKKIPDPVEQEHYLKELSKKLDVSETSLRSAMTKVKSEKEPEGKGGKEKEKEKEDLEERLLSLLLFAPEYKNFFFRNIEKSEIKNISLREVYEFLRDGKLKEEIKSKLDVLRLRAEVLFEGFTQEKLGEEIFYLIRRLKKERLREEKREIQKELKEAEKESDSKKIKKLIKKLNELLKKEAAIS